MQYNSYNSQGNGNPFVSIGPTWTKAVKQLIIVNVVAFFLVDFFAQDFVRNYLYLTPLHVKHFKVWQLATYMFLHDNFLHIFFNMFALFMFGSEIEKVFGYKKFMQFYFLCGIGAGICCCLIPPYNIPTLGASGATFGLLSAYGLLYPNRTLLVFFVFPVKAINLIMIFAIISILSLLKSPDGVAHAAHLGGMGIGFLLIKYDLSRGVVSDRGYPFLSFLDTFSNIKNKMDEARIERSFKKEGDEKELVDALLDKIAKQGMPSLSKKERDFLTDFSKRQAQRRDDL